MSPESNEENSRLRECERAVRAGTGKQKRRIQRMFAALDTEGREAWITLLDQECMTFRDAVQRDYDTFVRVVQALERAGFHGDAEVRRRAGLTGSQEKTEGKHL